MNTLPAVHPTVHPHHTDGAASTRIFTGLKPTGQLHVGNYLGAIRPLIALTEETTNEVSVSIANLHALTLAHDPATLRQHTIEMAATLLACGLPETTRMFAQSTVPAYTELHYLLESTATYGEAHRMVQFKEKSQGQESHRLSLLTYPTLMSADILGTLTHTVPVGEDQRQHLELARTIAKRFNRTYGTVFVVPEPFTPTTGARVKDLVDPTAKMGKSGAHHNGVVFLLDPPDVIATKIRRATTDTERGLTYDPANRPGVANLATILAALTNQTPHEALTGLDGAGALKAAVTDALIASFAPIRETHRMLTDDETIVLGRLHKDAATVSATVTSTVAAAKTAMGLL